jgi:hypothetical protein
MPQSLLHAIDALEDELPHTRATTDQIVPIDAHSHGTLQIAHAKESKCVVQYAARES